MWRLTGKVEDRSEPLSESFFNNFKYRRNLAIVWPDDKLSESYFNIDDLITESIKDIDWKKVHNAGVRGAKHGAGGDVKIIKNNPVVNYIKILLLADQDKLQKNESVNDKLKSSAEKWIKGFTNSSFKDPVTVDKTFEYLKELIECVKRGMSQYEKDNKTTISGSLIVNGEKLNTTFQINAICKNLYKRKVNWKKAIADADKRYNECKKYYDSIK